MNNSNSMANDIYEAELYHHGILGQKWGVRRYQNEDGTLTDAGKARYLDSSTGKLSKKGEKLLAKEYNSAYKKAGQSAMDSMATAAGFTKMQYEIARTGIVNMNKGAYYEGMAENAKESGAKAADDIDNVVNLINQYRDTSLSSLTETTKNKTYSTYDAWTSIMYQAQVPVSKIKFGKGDSSKDVGSLKTQDRGENDKDELDQMDAVDAAKKANGNADDEPGTSYKISGDSKTGYSAEKIES